MWRTTSTRELLLNFVSCMKFSTEAAGPGFVEQARLLGMNLGEKRHQQNDVRGKQIKGPGTGPGTEPTDPLHQNCWYSLSNSSTVKIWPRQGAGLHDLNPGSAAASNADFRRLPAHA